MNINITFSKYVICPTALSPPPGCYHSVWTGYPYPVTPCSCATNLFTLAYRIDLEKKNGGIATAIKLRKFYGKKKALGPALVTYSKAIK